MTQLRWVRVTQGVDTGLAELCRHRVGLTALCGTLYIADPYINSDTHATACGARIACNCNTVTIDTRKTRECGEQHCCSSVVALELAIHATRELPFPVIAYCCCRQYLAAETMAARTPWVYPGVRSQRPLPSQSLAPLERSTLRPNHSPYQRQHPRPWL